MTAPIEAPRRTVAPRWMKVALLLSLAVNFLVLGAVGAATWRLRHDGPRALSAISPSGNLLGFTATLPAERRRAIWVQTTEPRRALRGLRAEVRRARQVLQEKMRAENFNASEFAQAQTMLLAAESKARTEAQKMFLSIVTQMSPDERAAFAKWEASPAASGRGRGRHWREPLTKRGTPEQPPGPTDPVK